ncbi:precorrin-6y C5,15-methyltransferase (decarboxylating) subunit CbiE [Tropicibacter sp. R15_0]|uniref:precorrin-6y C5,15-methyltransferase (decarboxylating) subunit CbiE n=1 Tax=Tropicibacter sp. R15_0 TaxID=2821101 RepID=UPI001ADAADE6|nr:precorrin-6y C5,15-methyltransferase (decarboxylating) subunit CbiE [Tropicibacter sp. R15_0]MBO9464681.1 precorrin-6y C5,15-methyltransferase (decarboxylating) subunit CbiE [Tropicibacter sp. R15_0]
MFEPWLTIIGIGEDGLNGLNSASRSALDAADFIFGGPRHLELANCQDRGRPWPVPFSVQPVLENRGQSTVILVSGDPFWYGGGASIARHLKPDEWVTHPAPSCFSLIAACKGWRIEETLCLGLHAAPFEQLTRHLGQNRRVICTLRDGEAPKDLAKWLTEHGFGQSTLDVFERLGGPLERHRSSPAEGFDLTDIQAPVAVALTMQTETQGGFQQAPGRDEDQFAHDGQITKSPVRAMTIAALQPRYGDVLWDLGAGSGSVSIEFLLTSEKSRAVCVEARADRAANITTNANRFGLSHRIDIVTGNAIEQIDTLLVGALGHPDAVFIGGGARQDLLEALFAKLAPGTRLVINAVTLETESLLVDWQARKGGELLKLELSQAAPLGTMRGWDRARPVIQWSVSL